MGASYFFCIYESTGSVAAFARRRVNDPRAQTAGAFAYHAFRKPLSRVESGVKPPGGKQSQSFPPGPPLAPMRCEKRLHMFGGSGCSGLLESPLTAEAILAKSPLEFLCRFRCSRNVHEMLMPSYLRAGRCPFVTQSGLPHSACLFSIRRQLMNPYMSLAKNITKQATIGTLAMSARAAMTHSTISTRSLVA